MIDAKDARHGTNRGYNAGCRCEGCKTGHAAYRANWRKRVYLNRGNVKLRALGTQRRIQALAALGWSLSEQDRRIGRSMGFTARVLRQDEVTPPIAEMYENLYDELSMEIPSGLYVARDRRRAARKGWLVPLMWDDDRIDDPTYEPLAYLLSKRRKDIDEAVVLRVLAGANAPTTPAERREIVRRWLAQGGSERDLCARMGWREGRYSPSTVGPEVHHRDAERRAS
jgi:hypothetical protein